MAAGSQQLNSQGGCNRWPYKPLSGTIDLTAGGLRFIDCNSAVWILTMSNSITAWLGVSSSSLLSFSFHWWSFSRPLTANWTIRNGIGLVQKCRPNGVGWSLSPPIGYGFFILFTTSAFHPSPTHYCLGGSFFIISIDQYCIHSKCLLTPNFPSVFWPSRCPTVSSMDISRVKAFVVSGPFHLTIFIHFHSYRAPLWL